MTKDTMPNEIWATEDMDFKRWWHDTSIQVNKKHFNAKYIRADSDEYVVVKRDVLEDFFKEQRDTPRDFSELFEKNFWDLLA